MHKMLKIVIGKKKWKQSIRDRHIKLNSQPHLFYTRQHKRHESWGNVENKKFTCNLAGKLRKFKIGICHNGSPLELFSELANSAAITPLVKKVQRAGFLLPISSKITPVKGKKGEKERARNTLLDWRKRSISKLRLDLYFLSLVRLTQWFWLSILRRYLFQRDHLSMVA